MGNIGTIIIVIVISVAIFLLLREVNCWYWKINKRVSLLEENNNLLKELLSKNQIDTNKEIEVVSPITSNLSIKEAKTITVRHKVTQKEQTVDLEFWEKMKQLYGEQNYDVIKYNN